MKNDRDQHTWPTSTNPYTTSEVLFFEKDAQIQHFLSPVKWSCMPLRFQQQYTGSFSSFFLLTTHQNKFESTID